MLARYSRQPWRKNRVTATAWASVPTIALISAFVRPWVARAPVDLQAGVARQEVEVEAGHVRVQRAVVFAEWLGSILLRLLRACSSEVAEAGVDGRGHRGRAGGLGLHHGLERGRSP
jgi:hypothetical protein